jgi:uncharacterized protein YraI
LDGIRRYVLAFATVRDRSLVTDSSRSGLGCRGFVVSHGRELVSGSHRAEPVRRYHPRQFRRVAAAVGLGAALLGVSLLVIIRSDTSSGPSTRTVAADDALRARAALEADRRASRGGTRSPLPVSPTRPTPAAVRPEPVPAVVGRWWVRTDVNVRSGPATDADRIGSLVVLSRVGVTGKTKSGWTQVVTDGRAGWVKSTYLSESKPKPRPAPAPPGVSNAPCPIDAHLEPNFAPNARSVYRATCAAFRDSVSSFGGYRAGDDGDHGTGRAVDITVSGDPGWDIVRYVQTHARDLGVTYVIYQQQMWFAGDPTGQWEKMEDRGDETANHFDHVHVSVS